MVAGLEAVRTTLTPEAPQALIRTKANLLKLDHDIGARPNLIFTGRWHIHTIGKWHIHTIGKRYE